jgi:hypothetical protein
MQIAAHLEVHPVDDVLYVLLEVLRVMAVQLQHKLGRGPRRHHLATRPCAAEALDGRHIDHHVYGAGQWVGDQEGLLAW